MDLSIPHHTTIRQWIIRFGCASLQVPLAQEDDWILIGDLTISVGKLKCLVTVGVRTSHLESREDLILTHKDIEVIGLYPTQSSTGKFAKAAFEDSANRVGGKLVAMILDQGSDVKMGARLFQETHKNVKVLHDISHKLSNLVEYELKNDEYWLEYIQKLNFTRRSTFQTELAAVMPKKQREKGRYMDIGDLVHWRDRVKTSKANGCFAGITEERYQEYLGWIEEPDEQGEAWKFIEGVVNLIKGTVRMYGYSMEVYLYLKIFFEEVAVEGERLENFVLKALNALWEEVIKLDEGQTLIGSTEVLESVFGKYKAINEGLHGITGTILGISIFVGGEKTEKKIKELLENCSVKSAVEFLRQKFGPTLSSLRKRFYPNSKRTKFDKEEDVVFTS